MYRLLEFIRSILPLLLFLVLEGAAILFYAHSDSYIQAKLLGTTAKVMGGVRESIGGVGGYISLRSENEMLLDRILELEGELYRLKAMHSDSMLMAHDSMQNDSVRLISARVVRNSTHKSRNFILINRGLSSGVRERMAVTTPNGEIVGSVVWSTERYAVVISLLNSEFISSGKILGSNHSGAISWNGESQYYMQLSDLSKYAAPFKGAQIITTGLSQIFPEGLSIGRVVDYSLSDVDGAYLVNFEIAADMSALRDVVVIGSPQLSEEQAAMRMFEEQEGQE